MSSSRLLALVLAAAGCSAAAACSMSSSSTDGCTPTQTSTCIALADAWMFLETHGTTHDAGGRPDVCPRPGAGSSDEYAFILEFKLRGTTLVGDPTRNGDKCCYVTTSYCEGRPLLVHGEARVASLSRRHGWT